MPPAKTAKAGHNQSWIWEYGRKEESYFVCSRCQSKVWRSPAISQGNIAKHLKSEHSIEKGEQNAGTRGHAAHVIELEARLLLTSVTHSCEGVDDRSRIT